MAQSADGDQRGRLIDGEWCNSNPCPSGLRVAGPIQYPPAIQVRRLRPRVRIFISKSQAPEKIRVLARTKETAPRTPAGKGRDLKFTVTSRADVQIVSFRPRVKDDLYVALRGFWPDLDGFAKAQKATWAFHLRRDPNLVPAPRPPVPRT